MSCLKFNFIIILIFSFGVSASEKFTSEACLAQEIQTEINHSGKFFGLLTNTLKLKKSKCNIRVSLKTVLTESWDIDICKEPVHVKHLKRGSEEVYKKKRICSTDSKDKFCLSWKKLKSTIQDHGLIFAEGERETLDTVHGKTYCIYLLLNKYLDENVRFSTHSKPIDLYSSNVSNDKMVVEQPSKNAIDNSNQNSVLLSSPEENGEVELIEGQF